MKVFKEFREFAVRGNVIDLAVGVIIGGAFGKIVTSLVNDIILPPLGILAGGVDFRSLQFPLPGTAEDGSQLMLSYGAFLENVLDFLIIAFVIFLMVRTMNRALKKEEGKKPEAGPSAEEKLLAEIRDILKRDRI